MNTGKIGKMPLFVHTGGKVCCYVAGMLYYTLAKDFVVLP